VPIIIENIACATNSSLDQAILIEENSKLKAQLEKERLASPQLGKTPHELFAQQKERPRGQGLGFNPRNNNNYVIPPKKINFVKEGYKGNGNGKKDTMGGMPIGAILTIVLLGRPTHPMCCVRTRMEVYLLDMLVCEMVMPINSTRFGYLNLLLLMLGVSLPNGLLNPRIDFVGLFLRWAKVVV
jgi:hypothetical protein